MIETLAFALGLGFSILVCVRSISRAPISPLRKIIFAVLSSIGITGMLWLSGVLIAHFLPKVRPLLCSPRPGHARCPRPEKVFGNLLREGTSALQ